MKQNNAGLGLLILLLMFVYVLFEYEPRPEKVVPSNEDVAIAYMADEHPEDNCTSVKIYDDSEGEISFISYDQEGNPILIASINKEYYTDKYFD